MPRSVGGTQVDGSFWHDWGFLRGAYMHNDIACGGTEQQPNNCKPKAAHALNAAAVRYVLPCVCALRPGYGVCWWGDTHARARAQRPERNAPA
jgi:hypothetical protein